MVRTEIYANRSVEENVLSEIEAQIPDIHYSLFEDVQGKGNSGVRKGTAIWPELNVLYVMYHENSKSLTIAEAVKRVKNNFPNEGIKIFQYEFKDTLTE